MDPSYIFVDPHPMPVPFARMTLVPVLRALSVALIAGWGLVHAAQPTLPRQHELVRMVRQDCGSCHGLHLTGGLGPALTRQALAGKPLESVASTIYGGRPGTPMAPWKAMLTEDEAQWIAEQLLDGFPELKKGSE